MRFWGDNFWSRFFFGGGGGEEVIFALIRLSPSTEIRSTPESVRVGRVQ